MKNLLFVSLILVFHCLSSQNIAPFQDSRTLKWGFRDSKNVIISAEYTEVMPYKEGYAWVKVKDLWAIIYKTQKKFILEPSYTEVIPLKNKLFAVKDKSTGMVGITNLKGTLLQPCKFQSIEFWEKFTQMAWLDTKKAFVLPNTADTLIAFGGLGSSELLDLNGNTIKVLDFQRIHGFDTPNYCLTYNIDKRGFLTKWGLINTKAEIILPCVYDDIGGSSQIGGFTMCQIIFLNEKEFVIRKEGNCSTVNIKGEVLKKEEPCQ